MKLQTLLLAAVPFLSVTAFSDEPKTSSSSFVAPTTVRWDSIRLQPRLIGFAVAEPGQPVRMFRRKTAQGHMFFTLGESAASAPPALVQYRDEWDEREEWDADDYRGAIRSVNDDRSRRHRGDADSFPLREGGTIVETPEIASYAALTTQSLAPGPAGSVVRQIVGRGELCALPGEARSGRALGEYEERLSVEDREADALRRVVGQLALPPDRRAPGAVQRGEEPVAFFSRRGSGQGWLIQQTRLTSTFAVKSAASLVAKVEYQFGTEKRTDTFAVTNPGNGAVTVVIAAVPRPYANLFQGLEPATHQIEVAEAEVRCQLNAVTLIENSQP